MDCRSQDASLLQSVFEMEFCDRDDLCKVCHKIVTVRQHALECDACGRWVHRLCFTGTTYTQYRGIMENMRHGGIFPWRCQSCKSTTEMETSSRQLRTTGTWRPVTMVTQRSLTPSSELQSSRVPDWTRHFSTYYFRCIVIASRSTQAPGRPGSQVISRSIRS